MKETFDKQGDPKDFSLGVGGPLYKFLGRLGLPDSPLLLYKRRIIIISLLTWFPLLVLSVLSGVAFGGVQISFIHDVDVHVRFLLVLPMLLFAEVIAHRRLHIVVEQFLKCNIIALKDKITFNHGIASVMRLKDSIMVEIALIILVYTAGHWISTEYLPLSRSSWFVAQNDIPKLTLAGCWYLFFSLPIFQFVLLRWYFRILIWYRFLWQTSRLSLQLNSLHPDRAGGLGFLADSIYVFGPFLLTHSVLLSGVIFNRIWNAGAIVSNFQREIISVLVFVLIIPLMPLLFFIFQMIKEKRLGTLKYGVVASRYVNDFRKKWIVTVPETNPALLGTSDIQSLADLFNSFEVSNKMRITPFNRSSVMALVALTALPLLPLILTMIPIEKIIGQIFGLIL